MNIFFKLDSLTCSKNEKNIIELIKNDPLKFSKLSLDEASYFCNVSKSTMIRFCKKMGCGGFSDFKLALVASYFESVKAKEDKINFNFPFSKSNSDHEVILNLKKVYEYALESMIEYLDIIELLLGASIIKKASRLILYSSLEVKDLSNIFKVNLEKIGKSVLMSTDLFSNIFISQGMGQNDLFIYIDYDEDEALFKEVIKLYKLNKVNILLISTNKNRINKKICTINLYLPKQENKSYNIGNYFSHVSLMYILDILYSLVYKLDFEKNTELLHSGYLKYENL